MRAENSPVGGEPLGQIAAAPVDPAETFQECGDPSVDCAEGLRAFPESFHHHRIAQRRFLEPFPPDAVERLARPLQCEVPSPRVGSGGIGGFIRRGDRVFIAQNDVHRRFQRQPNPALQFFELTFARVIWLRVGARDQPAQHARRRCFAALRLNDL